ncbi:MAG: TonB-dependent receptor [Syntrophales bacterium]|jgi:iron complex outermembrane receptor protein|nr:TonB-dependent receptor [Syntrophales bacterium]MCK9527480.1 TonB-dependent receptor [Syntrophales bacterium]MDX9922536.1 TonB-dependent receptor [Syntrophales bacterium]
MKHLTLFLAATSILFVSQTGWAQHARGTEQEHTVVLEEVVVTATRGIEEVRKIPANVSVITADDIEQSGATSVVELLEKLESVNVRSYSGNPSEAMVDLRGMGGDNPFGTVLVMLDGRRLNRPDMHSINWLQVPLATIDRIEVVRGSGAVLYGDSAVAGVINIITKKGTGPPTLDASVMIGSYGLHNERLGVSGSKGNLSYSLFGENLKTFGYRERSKFSSRGAGLDVGYAATDTIKLSFGFSCNETDYDMPGALTKAQMAVDRKQAQSPAHLNDESSDRYSNIHILMEKYLGDSGEFSLGIAYGSKKLEPDMPSQWSNQYNTYDMGTLAITPRYVLESTIAGQTNKLTLGLDFYRETMDLDKYGDPGRSARTHAIEFTKRSIGGYLRNEFSLLPSLVLSAGLRAEQATITGGYHNAADPTERFDQTKKVHRATAWDAGLTWLCGEKSNLFATYGTFFRYPFLDEQASYLGFPITFLENLDKERGRSYEVGGRFSLLENLRVGLTAYRIDMKDKIVYVGLWPTGQNRNLDSTRHEGLEFNARYRLDDLFTMEGNAAFSRSKFREGICSGNDVPMAPRFMSSLALEIVLPGDLIFRPEVHHVGDAFLADDFDNNTEKLEGRTTFDLYLHYRPVLERVELRAFLGIENITDEEYATYGFDMQQWGGDNTYYPAPGRTIKGGLSVRF